VEQVAVVAYLGCHFGDVADNGAIEMSCVWVAGLPIEPRRTHSCKALIEGMVA
jgi:hypothetical protein